jgi:hypothetical protein
MSGDEDVDVRPDDRPGVQEPVPKTRDPLVELVDDLGDGGPGDLEPPRRFGEERDQGTRQMDDRRHRPICHRVSAQSTTAASTDQIGGRFSTASDQVRPSSALAKIWPLLVPKYTPTGSSRSTAIASRRTPR